MVKKKSAAQKKAAGKKSVTKKKKVSVKKKAKPVKKKTATKKSTIKKAKPSTKAKPKAKAKPVKKKTTAKKTTAKKGKSSTKPSAKKKTKVQSKKKAPARKKAAQTKKAVPKKKSTPKTVSDEYTPAVEKKKTVAKLPKSMDPIIKKIREKLLINRGEVLKMLESSQAMERDVEGLTFSNEIDLASSLEGREMVFQLSSRDRRELKLIDEALIKIKEGTYGICESCGKRIGSKRLQILPLTTLCIECKESAENF